MASLDINNLWEKAPHPLYENILVLFGSRKCGLRVYAGLRPCTRSVYETYFSVEPLSMARLQRRRANRRALPNANTVFTCDCSSMHLAVRWLAYSTRVLSSFYLVSSRRSAHRWSVQLRLVRGLSSVIAMTMHSLAVSHKDFTVSKLTNNLCVNGHRFFFFFLSQLHRLQQTFNLQLKQEKQSLHALYWLINGTLQISTEDTLKIGTLNYNNKLKIPWLNYKNKSFKFTFDSLMCITS